MEYTFDTIEEQLISSLKIINGWQKGQLVNFAKTLLSKVNFDTYVVEFDFIAKDKVLPGFILGLGYSGEVKVKYVDDFHIYNEVLENFEEQSLLSIVINAVECIDED